MRKGLLFCLAVLLLFQAASAQEVDLTISGLGNHSSGSDITGTLEIVHSKYIPGTASIRAYIDSDLVSTIPLQGYLEEPGYYSFESQPFSYNLSANGQNTWDFYTTLTFDYTIYVTGTCGHSSGPTSCCSETECWCQCQCGNNSNPDTFPCDWSADKTLTSRNVNGKSGLKPLEPDQYIPLISLPVDNNPEDTTWSISGTNTHVELTMRAACGLQAYEGYNLLSNGWWFGNLENWEEIPGTGDRKVQIVPFDATSLNYGSTLYGGGPGGLFRNGLYQSYETHALWYSNGTIVAKDFDPQAVYTVRFLPPSGPKPCAYTGYKTSDLSDWTRNVVFDGSATYAEPYNQTFSDEELSGLLRAPNCPSGSSNCVRTVIGYTAVKTTDPGGTIDLSYGQDDKSVTATTSSLALSRTYSETIGLETLKLDAPDIIGLHELELKVYYQGAVEGSGSGNFFTCLDADGDGYCPETGDCDDSDTRVRPGAAEFCNGVDDNCNGEIDEDFWAAGSKLGSPCGVGVCGGYYVCTPDGMNVTCSQKYMPGQFKEICDNGLDDDCDGVVDEEFVKVDGRDEPACWCDGGSTRPCGSNVGACREGYMICSNYQWSGCTDAIGPSPETCNRIDDDCDGKTDNIGGSTSVQSARCGCYNNAQPSDETCNEIDDDCDGEVDEGLVCCDAGQTKPCGSNVGACREGIKTCGDDGSWGSCKGGVVSVAEICYDRIDNDCDGKTDEDCKPEMSCQNGIKDLNENGIDCGGPCPRVCRIEETPLPYIILSLIGVVLIILAGVVAIKTQRAGPEGPGPVPS